ncbi:MAG: hypothetical protein AAB834_01120 [Patescibacteria group bacterium]|mgnify:CR=1 FL=1
MQLSENIRTYYFAHFNELNADKRFHFCTRLAAWYGDQQAVGYLKQVRASFVPDPCTKDTLRASLEELTNQAPDPHVNARLLRDVYFDAYPQLRGIGLAMFRVRHLRAVYGIDARPALFDLMSRQELLKLKNQLLQDQEAVRILSTFAVNFIYLLERLVLEHTDSDAIDVNYFYKLGEGYDTTNPDHVRLLTYLYMHCIIAESNFYTKAIPKQLLPGYARMLQKLEAIISEHYIGLSLDTKLEFLVCCRICGFDSSLTSRIYTECQASLSSDGTFIVDTQNTFAANSLKKTFEASEHRNVLFIMSASAYRPHSTLVG